MSADRYFSSSYAAARRRFREAAGAAGMALDLRPSPARDREGEALAVDLAYIGPRDPARAVVAISGTHGVEGYCGAGVQVGWLESGLWRERPAEVGLLLIHAINPYGFAWDRRVTEDNVDLNRNFPDFSAPLPRNHAYEALHEAACPVVWTEESVQAANAVLEAYREAHGAHALQVALSGGQYSHSDGIFYGGRAPTWSHRTLVEVLRHYLGKTEKVAVVDFHTGLGPYGYGEPISIAAPDSPEGRRAVAWYGGEVTFTSTGTSTSAVINGSNDSGVKRILPQAEVTMIALEFGTRPLEEVLFALRADNWLHRHGRVDSGQGRDIKAAIRAAFYPERADWRRMVWERSVDILAKATRGVSQE